MSVLKPAMPRRVFVFRTLSFVPVTATGLAALTHLGAFADQTESYAPSFFNADEWRFVNAFVDRLIPHDDVGPGAVEAGVPAFIDQQMATKYGYGGLWYMLGPFAENTPATLGYQLNLTPRQLYKAGIAAADRAIVQAHGKSLADLDDDTKDDVLKAMEAGTLDIGKTPPSDTLFGFLWQNTQEGYFSDPAYGGNKDASAWSMIGFPGARGDYLEWVDQYGKKYPYAPTTIGSAENEG
jgi:gluconate 2-dehydrogenase gamma chain